MVPVEKRRSDITEWHNTRLAKVIALVDESGRYDVECGGRLRTRMKLKRENVRL